MGLSGHRITDRALLREAVAEWQRAGGLGAMGRNIFELQAAQGYYDDAAGTGLLFDRPDGVRWSVVELAGIRAKNGDLAAAKAMMQRFAGSDLAAQIAEAIALAEADRGDLQGALELAAVGVDREEILLAYARRQMKNGDFAVALETAARMKSPDQVFYELGNELAGRGEQRWVRELISGMRDGELAAKFEKLMRVTLWPTGVMEKRPSPCEIAAGYGEHGKFAEADALVEQNDCTSVSFLAIRQYAVDPAGAERLLRRRSAVDDLLFGLDQLTIVAARNGNLTEALRFLADLQKVKDGIARNSVVAEDRITDAIRGIARYWTIRDGPKVVLKWARSRPAGEQRTCALIGMAQALGHAQLGE